MGCCLSHADAHQHSLGVFDDVVISSSPLLKVIDGVLKDTEVRKVIDSNAKGGVVYILPVVSFCPSQHQW